MIIIKFLQIKIDYYCDVCDKTIKLKSKNSHLNCFTHFRRENSIRTKHTIKNLDFSDKDEVFKD